MSVKELCRSGGISQPTFYKWRPRFGGMEPSDAAKLRELEAENNKLKKLLAEAHLDIHAFKKVGVTKQKPVKGHKGWIPWKIAPCGNNETS
jgi:putative transposase